MNYKKRLWCEFIITKIDHIVEHIIPFYDKHPKHPKHPIQGVKTLKFIIF